MHVFLHPALGFLVDVRLFDLHLRDVFGELINPSAKRNIKGI